MALFPPGSHSDKQPWAPGHPRVNSCCYLALQDTLGALATMGLGHALRLKNEPCSTGDSVIAFELGGEAVNLPLPLSMCMSLSPGSFVEALRPGPQNITELGNGAF